MMMAVVRAVGGAVVMVRDVGARGVAAAHADDKCGNGGVFWRDGRTPAAAGQQDRACQRGETDELFHFGFSFLIQCGTD